MTGPLVLEDRARPKVNLTLEVLGRRPDGYHELVSLVAFASGGDSLTLELGEPEGLIISGPWGRGLAQEGTRNLILRALDALRCAAPSARAGLFRLEKNLPVASGIGGGSSDAAAALRLLRRANPELAGAIDWYRLAASLGADVPVCLDGRPAVMSGIGHELAPLARWPELAILLVNPGVPLSTAAVFQALAAPPCEPGSAARMPLTQPPSTTGAELLTFLRARRNDLEPAARRLCPAIGEVLHELSSLERIELARMSGSGPTCFGVFENASDAEAAARAIASRQPGWWISAGTLG